MTTNTTHTTDTTHTPAKTSAAATMPAPSGKPVALFAVKAVHTLIFFSLAWAILYVLYCGLSNRATRKTAVAIAAVLIEAVIFVGNGGRCPLTKLAEGLGASNGTVGDIFLPPWLARRIPVVSSTLFGLGLAALLRQRIQADTQP